MYDELVKSIHCCFGFDSMQTDCENCMMKDKREEHNYVGCCDALGLAAAEAIEELQKVVEKEQAFAKCWEEMATDCKERFQELLDAYPKWIPVTERLPEDGVPVQVCYIGFLDGETASDLLACRYEGMWCYWDGPPCGYDKCKVEITHWMPLPQPPKEG